MICRGMLAKSYVSSNKTAELKATQVEVYGLQGNTYKSICEVKSKVVGLKQSNCGYDLQGIPYEIICWGTFWVAGYDLMCSPFKII